MFEGKISRWNLPSTSRIKNTNHKHAGRKYRRSEIARNPSRRLVRHTFTLRIPRREATLCSPPDRNPTKMGNQAHTLCSTRTAMSQYISIFRVMTHTHQQQEATEGKRNTQYIVEELCTRKGEKIGFATKNAYNLATLIYQG